MTADIESLPGKDWNAHAVAGDIISRCPMDAQIIALWADAEGKIRYSKTGLEAATVSMFATLLMEMAAQRWREFLS